MNHEHNPDEARSQRDARGRFTQGNAGGPGGRPKGPAALLREALLRTVQSVHIEAVARRLLRMSLEGNLMAARMLLEMTIGKPAPAEADAQPLNILLPALNRAADCRDALDIIAAATIAGRLHREDAALLTNMVRLRLEAIQTVELEQRVEQAEADVDLSPEPDDDTEEDAA